MTAAPPPPTPLPPVLPAGAAARLDLGDRRLDLRTRALVTAIVPVPRFGRENEVLAAVAAAATARADLADVSLEPRLLGPAAQTGGLPISARVDDLDAAAAARAAGAALVLVPPDVAPAAVERGWTVAVVVEDVAALPAARDVAEDVGVPLALDAARLAGADALAHESVAVASGCRVVRTRDVARTRRVVEVVAALLEARRAG